MATAYNKKNMQIKDRPVNKKKRLKNQNYTAVGGICNGCFLVHSQ